jgi:hypothetical protein
MWTWTVLSMINCRKRMTKTNKSAAGRRPVGRKHHLLVTHMLDVLSAAFLIDATCSLFVLFFG